MSYQNPLPGVPDPYEGYRSEPLFGGRSSGGPPEEEPPKKKGLLAHVLKLIQQRIDSILDRLGGNPTPGFKALKTLKSLKSALEILKTEDRSQDIDFLNELAQYWNWAMEESLELPQNAKTLFRIFVKKILQYPPNQTHSFGYYLMEHAGQKWIPFPYMELVQKIHTDHEKNPTSSDLTEWVRLLQDAISLLQET